MSNVAAGETAVPSKEAVSAEPCPTSVYLFFDRIGILVYVGVTSRGVVRQREHNADKAWWPYVSRQEVEHYPTRARALIRERELITLMCPPFNSAHNPDRAARSAYLALVAMNDSPGIEPAGKWIPMRVGLQHENLLVVLTHMKYAGATAMISTDAGFVVRAAGFKVRGVVVRRIGSALAVAMHIKGAPMCVDARLKYKHVPGGRQIKCLDLVFAPDRDSRGST
jgi:hypothetical protein